MIGKSEILQEGRRAVMREFLEELEKSIQEGNMEARTYDQRGSFSSALFLSSIKKKYEEELKR